MGELVHISGCLSVGTRQGGAVGTVACVGDVEVLVFVLTDEEDDTRGR